MSTKIVRILGIGALAANAAFAAESLPSSAELAKELAPYLAKPLPSVESLIGVAMPPPAPLMVVASLSDDDSQSELDRGYAVGFTLNELLFDADPKLDVLAPWYYAYDTRKKDVPTGTKRDSAGNAYRAGSRNHARWCAHGRVSGAGPTRVELIVDGCAAGNSSHKKQWTVRAEHDWPATLAEMCEFASASATGELTPRARASCRRGLDIRPASLMALARFGKQYRTWKALEAMVEVDPKFAPAVVEYLYRIEYYGEWPVFWDRLDAVAKAVPQSSAVQLLTYSRLASTYGWKISAVPYPRFFVWVRNHPHLSSAWLALASGLSGGNPSDWPASKSSPPMSPDGFPVPIPPKDYPPNEATHTASLTLSLAIYRNSPQSYRSLWMMGYALERYGWMLRGSNFWRDVPDIGKRGFPVMIDWADRFNQATLGLHPEADRVWNNRMNTAMLAGEDWLPIFDRAVEVNPTRRGLYEDAMSKALDRWGGDDELRARIQRVAREKNPGAKWAETLQARWEEAHSDPNR
jgi:hypothetical protein